MEDNFATEILRELKITNKRMFIAFLIAVILELFTIGGFLWYISLPVDDIAIEQDADEQSTNQIIGGDYNGS